MQAFQLPASGLGRSALAARATATVLVAGLSVTNAAQERDVAWSVGIGAPGVSVGVTNGYGYAPPAYVAAPVYNSYPAPVYVPPPRVVYNPPVYYAPRPVYYAPPVVYAPQPNYYRGPGWDRRGKGHGHGDRNHNGRHDRGDHRGYR